MEEPLRVRVVFDDDRKMLTKAQRSEGLNRCWLLLTPDIATISDIESHVRSSFDLNRSCPHGLVLSMEDFVLPPFESASVLKDKDIIRVRKKNAIRMDAINFGDDRHCIQDSGAQEKQLTVSHDKLLAIKEFGEGSGSKRKCNKHLSAYNETAICLGTSSKSKNKRKHPDGIHDSKRKKLKTVADEDLHLGMTSKSSQNKGTVPESSKNKNNTSTVDERPGVASDVEEYAGQMPSSLQKEKRRKKSKLFDGEDIHLGKALDSSQNKSSSQKSSKKKNKPSTLDERPGVASDLKDYVEPVTSPLQKEKRDVQNKEDIEGNTCETHINGSIAKVSSRNARRKKAKRQWLKDLKSQLGQNTQSNSQPDAFPREPLEWQETLKKIHNQEVVVPVESQQQQETEENSEPEKEIIPVVVRPGHIRFQPLDNDEDQVQLISRETTASLDWNGTTSKKKGQKWGQEKTTGNWNDSNGFTEQHHGKATNVGKWNNANGSKVQQWDREKAAGKWNDANGWKSQKPYGEKPLNKWKDADSYKGHHNGNEKIASKWNDANTQASSLTDAGGSKGQPNEKAVCEKGLTGRNHINFESLFPLTRIPQAGDVLAYRLIELSSSWCPEVSSFRVGEVTSYNYLDMSIILVPVSEHPIFSDEEIDRRDSMLQTNSSPYKEDGSLQIHYPSLIDVRLLKASDSEATTSDYPEGEAHVNNGEPAVVNNSHANHNGPEMSTQEASRINNMKKSMADSAAAAAAKENVTQPTENGNASGSAWDQIKQALNEKKAELEKKKKDGWDEWSPSKSTAGTSWSYRVLRKSAVGPTLAFVRGGKHDGRKNNGRHQN